MLLGQFAIALLWCDTPKAQNCRPLLMTQIHHCYRKNQSKTNFVEVVQRIIKENMIEHHIEVDITKEYWKEL